MKKKIICFAIVVMILAISLAGCANQGNSKTVLEIDKDNLATVVFSDLCFDGTANDDVRKKMMDKVMLDEEGKNKYGLIVVNGNLVDGEDNGTLMRKVCDIIDSYKVPWAVSLGKKDVTGNANKKEIIKILLSYENSYFMAGDTYGSANYAFDVVFNGKLVHTLYFLDTTEELSDNQVVWYSNIVKQKADKYGDKIGNTENVISSLFMNNPFKEIMPLVDEWKAEGSGNLPSYANIATLENDSDLYKQIKQLDSTFALFFGNNPYTYFIRSKHDINYTMCRNMYFTDNKDQKSLYGAVSYSIKNSKFMSVSSIPVSLSAVTK